MDFCSSFVTKSVKSLLNSAMLKSHIYAVVSTQRDVPFFSLIQNFKAIINQVATFSASET